MTYKSLAKLILELPEANQNDDVTVFDPCEDEFYPVLDHVRKAHNLSELDEGHLFLVLSK